jgi:hypothetical protein
MSEEDYKDLLDNTDPNELESPFKELVELLKLAPLYRSLKDV